MIQPTSEGGAADYSRQASNAMGDMDSLDPILASFLAIGGFDRRRREYRRLGWIYAARNESFRDPVYKVGQSTRPPTVRVGELSAATAVYHDFELVYFVHVSD